MRLAAAMLLRRLSSSQGWQRQYKDRGNGNRT
jgi:hypothetical protein